ncbi:MAG: hypothetical protein KIS80_03020 [Anaerolineales bacterium]|nr:hypothetical protein [Anaerolineales bacterium]MCW5855775.1 hypothetical protein [Anaerolineales bacterium]MCW5877825.1 hypothetical protein [Anaerolineales bacterium]
MDTGLLRKFEKAKTYAEERSRMTVESMVVHFSGVNNPHRVEYRDGSWHCDCEFFVGRNECSHTMALDMVLTGMLPQPV